MKKGHSLEAHTIFFLFHEISTDLFFCFITGDKRPEAERMINVAGVVSIVLCK